jgi:hypothetical protein
MIASFGTGAFWPQVQCQMKNAFRGAEYTTPNPSVYGVVALANDQVSPRSSDTTM